MQYIFICSGLQWFNLFDTFFTNDYSLMPIFWLQPKQKQLTRALSKGFLYAGKKR